MCIQARASSWRNWGAMASPLYLRWPSSILRWIGSLRELRLESCVCGCEDSYGGVIRYLGFVSVALKDLFENLEVIVVSRATAVSQMMHVQALSTSRGFKDLASTADFLAFETYVYWAPLSLASDRVHCCRAILGPAGTLKDT